VGTSRDENKRVLQYCGRPLGAQREILIVVSGARAGIRGSLGCRTNPGTCTRLGAAIRFLARRAWIGEHGAGDSWQTGGGDPRG